MNRSHPTCQTNRPTIARTLSRHVLLLLAMLVSSFSSAALANVYCIDTTSTSLALSLCTAAPGDCSLRGAFAAAESAPEGSTVDIRVPAGSYTAAAGLSFQPGGSNDSKTFTFSGGWDATCSTHTIDPANTVINGENGTVDGAFGFHGDQHSIVVEGLTFLNFSNFEVLEYACGTFDICPDTQTIRVRYNHFDGGKRIWLHADDASTLSFSNNLVTRMDSATDVIRFEYNNNENNPGFAYNTLAGMHCSNGSNSAVYIRSELSGSRIHHNIFQSTGCAADLNLVFAGMVLTNNLYDSLAGQPPTSPSGNIVSTNPGFVDAAGGNYHLKENAPISVAINSGLSPLAAAQLGVVFPSQDLDGPAGKRVIGQHIDIGAFESSIDDSSVITVNSDKDDTLADDGKTTLREAILSANATPGNQSIHFNIPGGCPHLILLGSALPDITDTVEIDGYSEPESSANTLDTGSDAELCIILIAQSGTLPQMLQVPQSAAPDTSLTVKGIAFAGGTFGSGNATVFLRLRGGDNHLIQGNAFGGTGPGSIGDLGQPIFGIQIRNDAENVLIGGPLPEHRNSFGGMSSSAIVINDATSGDTTPHTIQNNYIGLSASGTVAEPIGLNGIYASNSPNVRIYDNVIAAVPSSPAIAISGATASGYQIRGNRIGMNVFNVATAAYRVKTGISISSGSGGHDIGSAFSNTQSNQIANTGGAGVSIASSAGTGTLVRSNRIFNTGNDGAGLAIDIGTLGQLANDASDIDTGANDGQNWPSITASADNMDGTRDITVVLDSLASTSYQIDVYRSPSCAGGSRGGDLYQSVLAVQDTSDGSGHLSISSTVSGSGGPAYLTAIATDLNTGSTSEISPCFDEALNLVPEVFSDGFE